MRHQHRCRHFSSTDCDETVNFRDFQQITFRSNPVKIDSRLFSTISVILIRDCEKCLTERTLRPRNRVKSASQSQNINFHPILVLSHVISCI